MTWQEDLAARLLQLRRQKGISQEELAAAAGVSRQAVSKWESAQSQPETEKLLAISAYFDVSLDWLLKGEETPANAKAGERKSDGRLILMVATILIWCGLLLGWAIWDYWRISLGAIVSMIAAVVALAVFYYQLSGLSSAEKQKLQARFWLMNIWPVVMLVLASLYSLATIAELCPVINLQMLLGARYWMGVGGPILLLGIYLIICVSVAVWARRRLR